MKSCVIKMLLVPAVVVFGLKFGIQPGDVYVRVKIITEIGLKFRIRPENVYGLKS